MVFTEQKNGLKRRKRGLDRIITISLGLGDTEALIKG
jgi:hypothetical protein